MVRCPSCKTGLVRVAPQQGILEWLLGLLTMYTHRCQLCGARFLAFRGFPAIIPRREFRRVRVDFPAMLRSAFYRKEVPAQQAMLVDLSIAGCRLEGLLEVADGTRLRVEFTTPIYETPVVVDEAVVCSHPTNGLGLVFTKVRRDERRRIARIIRERSPMFAVENVPVGSSQA